MKNQSNYLADAIKYLRHRFNLSELCVANHLKIPKEQYIEIEKGKTSLLTPKMSRQLELLYRINKPLEKWARDSNKYIKNFELADELEIENLKKFKKTIQTNKNSKELEDR